MSCRLVLQRLRAVFQTGSLQDTQRLPPEIDHKGKINRETFLSYDNASIAWTGAGHKYEPQVTNVGVFGGQ